MTIRPDVLSASFRWADVERSETAARLKIDNTLPDILQVNVARTAQLMECIVALLGEPVRVTSWYRCWALNEAVGGSKTSAHPRGLAVDWVPARSSLQGAFELVARSFLPFDQLVIESTKSGSKWIHLGLSEIAPRREVLRAEGNKLAGPMTFERVAVG